MTAAEINTQACGTKGDVVSWKSLQEQGASTRTKTFLPLCNGKYKTM